MLFRDRSDAGEQLGEVLVNRAFQHPLVLGIARGGVIVAAAAAAKLKAPLDLLLVRKIGAPNNPELAIGATAGADLHWIDSELAARVGADKEYVESELAIQTSAIATRRELYFGGKSHDLGSMTEREVIVIDDGLATGASARMAGMMVRRMSPQRLILAVPVASPSSLSYLTSVYDEIICPNLRDDLFAVGQFYADFSQTTDDEVRRVLEERGLTSSKPI